MKREDIDKAASDYAEENSWYPGETSYESDIIAIEESFADAFKAGAEWRINSVWHDAKEEPKYDEYFLYENVVHAYHVDGIYPSEDEPFVWDDYVKDWRLIRWAYIKDLIPNKEE